jgi:hypothetical protein
MERRDFIGKAALSAFLVAGFSITDVLAVSPIKNIHLLTPKLKSDFAGLLNWMNTNGWLKFLNDHLNIKVDMNGGMEQFTVKYSLPNVAGFDDFAGKQLLTPGFPALSLLYHMLASPRVKPAEFTDSQYPSVNHLDILENVIYGLADYRTERFEDTVIAVFAYEYRPAFKTPHHCHADMVFSQTGIARIGEKDSNYDAPNRCYTNKPAVDADVKNVAVVPARYGVFLAKKINIDKLSPAAKASEDDKKRQFLLPFRKIFSGDDLIRTPNFIFKEDHVGEKLSSLLKFVNKQFGDRPEDNVYDLTRYPFYIRSGTPESLVTCVQQGSSALIFSKPEKLVRTVTQDGKIAVVHVDNRMPRYFSAMETINLTEEIELIDYAGPVAMTRSPNKYNHPRVAPLFVNVKFRFDAGHGDTPDFSYDEKSDTGKISHWDGSQFLDNGNAAGETFYAVLFLDNICDGCVTVDIKGWTSDLVPQKVFDQDCHPAFSIVTAPDFFPQADPLDLKGFDLDITEKRSNFFEGGLFSLSAQRLPPNQRTINPVSGITAFADKSQTSLAVVSGLPLFANPGNPDFNTPSLRSYNSSSYLPDVCSGIFAPGWDITYSNEDIDQTSNNYLSTRGLGSPFPEDMKLCAAMNGMWPAASPDASRTYQGGLLSNFRNPTAIPLLDLEIGLHPMSAACVDHRQNPRNGWDGEQGPFLQPIGDGSFQVNFADLARTDTVKKTLDIGLDLSQLRLLSSSELRKRMTCLRLSILKLPETVFNRRLIDRHADIQFAKSPSMTALWMISAEAVNWKNGATGLGIPLAFAGNTFFPQLIKAQSPGISGDGYLFVFALTKNESEQVDATNRNTQPCTSVFVCQVTETAIAWTQSGPNGFAGFDRLIWNT